MQDGIYTPFGLRALPEDYEQAQARQSSVFQPRLMGTLLSLVCTMLWIAFVGLFHR